LALADRRYAGRPGLRRVHRILVMRLHHSIRDHVAMDLAPAQYLIRINGHLGATLLCAFPAMVPRQQGADTVLTGLVDRSALYGILAEIDALGLDLLELRRVTEDRESPPCGGARTF
jgi:hypothetical protein